MDPLLQIERHYCFSLPSAYRAFFERGYLTPHSDTYLFLREAEWLTPAEMLKNGGFWGQPKPGLVAFAFNGGGDLWSWQTHRNTEAGEPAIVHCPHDCFEGYWYAPSFLAWFYRLSLEYAAQLDNDDDATARQRLAAWAFTLRDYGKPQWAADLESISENQVKTVSVGMRGKYIVRFLVSNSDINTRIGEAFGRGYVDSPYIWEIDGEPVDG